ncbi:histamine H2 receptor-like [Actinia tenebrosa]|uniref:Histamine H2 receptor-like n=1 Tax=Actinia tenebrosa TaxID=6105 RepID=A0A6P8HIZ8_ACTTE|nr:histamine H2 receptor-like [Actinia tenebrosa]XP_031555822.1 histamine H2 receptor-like [Actinia tenebrosa]XP_031555823.1 histamine H2 receptor-like [Actinia tenebrosa]
MAFNMTPFLPKNCYFLIFNREEIMFGRVYYLTAFIWSALLLIPSAFLNLLLLRSLYLSLALRKPSTLLLYSLSVSDLLIAIVLLPIYLTKKVAELTYNVELFCFIGKHSYFFGYLFSASSLFTVTALSIDRYLIIHKGVHYAEYVTRTKVTITVVSIWVISIFLSSLQFVIPTNGVSTLAGFVTAICFFVTVVFYYKMLLKLRKTKMEASQQSESATEISSIPRYRKVTRTIMILFMVFIFCYLPYFCTKIVMSIIGDAKKGVESTECVVTVLTYTRAFINPVILLCRTSEMKEAATFIMKRIIPC